MTHTLTNSKFQTHIRGHSRQSGAWPRASWGRRRSWPPGGRTRRRRVYGSACSVFPEAQASRSRRKPWPPSAPRSRTHPAPTFLSPVSGCGELEGWKGKEESWAAKSNHLNFPCSFFIFFTSWSCWAWALYGGISLWRFHSCPSWGRRVWRIRWPWSEKKDRNTSGDDTDALSAPREVIGSLQHTSVGLHRHSVRLRTHRPQLESGDQLNVGQKERQNRNCSLFTTTESSSSNFFSQPVWWCAGVFIEDWSPSYSSTSCMSHMRTL